MAEFKECRLKWSWILIGASGGGGRDSESVQALERKLFKNNHLDGGISARGGLEPAFRVLSSAIFHEFRSAISIKWKSVERSGKKIVVFL